VVVVEHNTRSFLSVSLVRTPVTGSSGPSRSHPFTLSGHRSRLTVVRPSRLFRYGSLSPPRARPTLGVLSLSLTRRHPPAVRRYILYTQTVPPPPPPLDDTATRPSAHWISVSRSHAALDHPSHPPYPPPISSPSDV